MNKKILISLFLSLVLIMAIGVTTSFAETNDIVDAPTFKAGLIAFGKNVEDTDVEVEGNKVILKNNIEITSSSIFKSADVILDLNGYTIQSELSEYFIGNDMFILMEGTNLTIIDSSSSKKGSIKNENENGKIILLNSGDLKIEEGNYIANGDIITGETGSIVINGGNFTSSVRVIHQQPIITLDYLYNGNITTQINGGNFETETDDFSLIEICGGSLTINNGNFNLKSKSQESHGYDKAILHIFNHMNVGKENENKVVINNGNFYSEQFSTVAVSTTIDRNNIPVEINGGTFETEDFETIRTMEEAKVIIKGNATFLNKSGRIATFSGKETIIEDGIFKGENYGVFFETSSSEEEGTTKAIIKNAKISSKSLPIIFRTDVTVEAGEFTADTTNPDSIGAEYSSGQVLIKGGKFTGSKAGLNVFYSENVNLKLEGGTFVATGTDTEKTLGGIAVLKGIKTNLEENINNSEDLKQLVSSGYRYDDDTITEKAIKYNPPMEGIEGELDLGEIQEFHSTTVASVKVISELEYIQKVLKDEQTNITLEGKFNKYPKLIVKPLEKDDEDYGTLLAKIGEDEVVAAFEVTVEGGEFEGKLLLNFSVDEKYNGKTIKIYHKLKNEEIDIEEVIVENGIAQIEIDELSPFMLSAASIETEGEENLTGTGTGESSNAGTNNDANIGDAVSTNKNDNKGNNPRTGDDIVGHITTFIVSLLGIGLVLFIRKQMDAK